MAIEVPDLELIKRPNHRTITLSEVMQRINKFVNTLRGIEFVIIVHRRGDPLDPGHLIGSRNVEPHEAREIVRAALKAYDAGLLGRDSPVVTPFSG